MTEHASDRPPTETELKLRVDDHAPVRERLSQLGARHLGTVLEHNRLFDHPDASLRRRDCGLRLRTVHPVAQPQADSGHPHQSTHADAAGCLTFKGPRKAGTDGFKIRPEWETEVENPAALEQILHQLNLDTALTYTKTRDSWQLGVLRVELDTVPSLGCFVELEAPITPFADAAAAVQLVESALVDLGLANAPRVVEGYPTLLAQIAPIGETRGVSPRSEDQSRVSSTASQLTDADAPLSSRSSFDGMGAVSSE